MRVQIVDERRKDQGATARPLGNGSRSVTIIGESAAIRELRQLVQRIAPTEASVLISGETGTGKELVARALHHGSPRSAGPFVAINCAAVPETLLEAELFGYSKGAFTGAAQSRRGLLCEASGGTLFLDEIGDLPVSMQPKLLRALQDRKVRPLGGRAEIEFDCRILSATNRNLDDEVQRRRFRRDLYYRLNVLNVFVPPLRARGNDVLLLADVFVQRNGLRRGTDLQLSEDVKRRLLAYDWPGNVRELENAIESASALSDGSRIETRHLPHRVLAFAGERAGEPGLDIEGLCSLEELERRHIARVLDATSSNKREAARILRVDRSTLYRKMKRYGL